MPIAGGISGGSAQRRYLTANSTQAAFSLHSAVARVAIARTGPDGITLSSGAHHAVIAMGKERGLRFTGFGKRSADNAVINYKAWLVKYLPKADAITPESALLRLFASGTFTLSDALVRPSNSTLILANEVRADGCTIAVAGVHATINTANGGSLALGAYNPGDDLNDAFGVIPDVFDHDGVVFEMTLGANCTEANMLYERTR